MRFDSRGERDDGKHTGVGFMDISKILVTQDAVIFGTKAFLPGFNDIHNK